MFVNIFEADSYEQEAQIKVVISLTSIDLIKAIKQGDILATEWLRSGAYDCEFRIIVQGRRTGVGKEQRIIDLRDGGPMIHVP